MMKTFPKYFATALALTILCSTGLIAQSGWTDPGGDSGQPLMEIWIYGAGSPAGTLEAGDQIAAFDGETLVGLLTLTVTPGITNWSSSRLLAYSKNTSGDQLYTPGHPLTIKCWDASENAPTGEIFYAQTWGDAEDIDFHNDWYAPTSDIEVTATNYGAYFPEEGTSTYCYVDLTTTDVAISYNATIVVTVWDNQTPAAVVTNAAVFSGGYSATNNLDGTYTLNLFAGDNVTPAVDYNYTITVEAATFDTEVFDYTVHGNNNGGAGYANDVFLNSKGNLGGVVYCLDFASGLYDSLAHGAVVSATIGDTVYSGSTDENGVYLIEDIPDGLWTFSVTYTGYTTDVDDVTIVVDITGTHDVNLDPLEGTIEGEVFKATTLFPIKDETIRVSLFDGGGNEVDFTTTNADGEYTLSYYAGTYDIVVKDNNIGTAPEYQTFTQEDYTMYPDVTEEINFSLLPDPYVPNYDSITGDPDKMWSIHIEMAKFGSNFLLPYDELVIFDTDQDPHPAYPNEPGKRVGVLHFSKPGSYQNSGTNVLEAFAKLSDNSIGFITGNSIEIWGYDVSHDQVYEAPVDWWFNPGVGTYSGTTFPDSLGNHVSYLNIYWGTVPGILNGIVTEVAAPNAPISGVAVEALNVFTQEVVASEVTDTDGEYSILLDQGSYDIRFSKAGLYTKVEEDVEITENLVTELDMQLDAQTPATIDYNFSAQGYYFIGRAVKKASFDMLPLLDNVIGGDPVFSVDRQDSWIENDAAVRLAYNVGNSAWETLPYEWDLLEGYQLYLQSDYEFYMNGYLVKPELNPIEFPSAGIYYVPYFPFDDTNPDDALTAFAGIFGELDWVMDSEGNRLHNDNGNWIDNIGVLSPAEGYKVKILDAATLIYPETVGKSVMDGTMLNPIYFECSGGNAAAWTYTIYIDTDDFEIGDEIAAFSDGVMVGSMVIDSDDPWQNDLNTFNVAVSGGYGINVPIEFMAWDASENVDYYVEFEMVEINSSCYAGINFPAGLDHFSYANIYRGTVRVDENQIDNNVRVYPNPVNSTLNIESVSNINKINVYNIYGALISVTNVNAKRQQMDVSNLTSGTYLIQLHTNTGVITKRVIIQ